MRNRHERHRHNSATAAAQLCVTHKPLWYRHVARIERFGSAGDGYQYHHIVTQGGANDGSIPAEQLQNTDNIVRLPTLLHEAVNGEYSSVKEGTNMTVYEWVQTQPYDVQRAEGLKILRDLNILK